MNLVIGVGKLLHVESMSDVYYSMCNQEQYFILNKHLARNDKMQFLNKTCL